MARSAAQLRAIFARIAAARGNKVITNTGYWHNTIGGVGRWGGESETADEIQGRAEDGPPEGGRKRPKNLTRGDEYMIERIVDRLHVSKTPAQVATFIRNKIKKRNKNVPEHLMQQAIKVALKRHAQNAGQYRDVMGSSWDYNTK